MRVSKNIEKGKRINDLNELVRLAIEKQSVVVAGKYGHWVKPAGFIVNWQLTTIVKFQYFYAIKQDAEFENATADHQ